MPAPSYDPCVIILRTALQFLSFFYELQQDRTLERKAAMRWVGYLLSAVSCCFQFCFQVA